MSKHTIARIENNLIFNGKYQLTAKEQKIVLFLISKVNPMAQFSFKPQVISTKDLGKLLLGKPRGSFYTEITDFISRLMTKRISFIVTAKMEGKEMTGHVNWFASIVGCYNDNGESSFEFSFNAALKPYLLELKEYTQIDYKEVLPLKSSFSIRMYQVFKAHINKMSKFQNKSKLNYNLDELKELLDADDKYNDFRNFNRKVLAVIKREINQHTSIRVKYTPMRTGRKITSIQFEFWEFGTKASLTSDFKKLGLNQLSFAQEKGFKHLVSFGVNESIAFEMLSSCKGSEILGFEDWYFSAVIGIFETKTSAETSEQKAGILVNWFLKKKVFEQGDMFAKIMEQLATRKKHLQNNNSDSWDNRQIAKNLTAAAFRKKMGII